MDKMQLKYLDSNLVVIINEIYLTQSTVEFSFTFKKFTFSIPLK